jgi:hypothetical protein
MAPLTSPSASPSAAPSFYPTLSPSTAPTAFIIAVDSSKEIIVGVTLPTILLIFAAGIYFFYKKKRSKNSTSQVTQAGNDTSQRNNLDTILSTEPHAVIIQPPSRLSVFDEKRSSAFIHAAGAITSGDNPEIQNHADGSSSRPEIEVLDLNNAIHNSDSEKQIQPHFLVESGTQNQISSNVDHNPKDFDLQTSNQLEFSVEHENTSGYGAIESVEITKHHVSASDQVRRSSIEYSSSQVVLNLQDSDEFEEFPIDCELSRSRNDKVISSLFTINESENNGIQKIDSHSNERKYVSQFQHAKAIDSKSRFISNDSKLQKQSQLESKDDEENSNTRVFGEGKAKKASSRGDVKALLKMFSQSTKFNK